MCKRVGGAGGRSQRVSIYEMELFVISNRTQHNTWSKTLLATMTRAGSLRFGLKVAASSTTCVCVCSWCFVMTPNPWGGAHTDVAERAGICVLACTHTQADARSNRRGKKSNHECKCVPYRSACVHVDWSGVCVSVCVVVQNAAASTGELRTAYVCVCVCRRWY